MELDEEEAALPDKPPQLPAPGDGPGAVEAVLQPVGIAGLAAAAALRRYSNLCSGAFFGGPASFDDRNCVHRPFVSLQFSYDRFFL